MDSTKETVEQSEEVPMPDIPEDIIFEHILPRLPVKPLGQFMSVKKSWYACIKSSSFVRQHFDLSDKNDDSCVHLLHTCFRSRDQPNCGKMYADGPNGYEKIADIKFPGVVVDGKSGFMVVGSACGLVCLTDDYVHLYGRKILFWNPLIGKVRANMVSTCAGLFSNSSWVSLAFFYDSDENDHKLVRLVYVQNTETRPYFSTCHVEVYSFRTNSWSYIGDGVVNPYISSCKGGVFANGCLYWLATFYGDDGMLEVILSFDIKNRVFRTVEWPFDATAVLMNYMGSLAIFLKLWSWNMKTSKGGTLRVWRECDEGDAWDRIFKVVKEERINRSFGIAKNESVFLLTDDMRVIEYDPRDHSIRNIAVSEYQHFNQMVLYRESLLLLDEEDDSAGLEEYMAKEAELKQEEFDKPSEEENASLP